MINGGVHEVWKEKGIMTWSKHMYEIFKHLKQNKTNLFEILVYPSQNGYKENKWHKGWWECEEKGHIIFQS